MTPINVLVYDDKPDIASLWVRNIEEAYSDANVSQVGQEGFLQLIELVQRRRSAWRSDGDIGSWDHAADKADVIVIDYDLLDYSDSADTTGTRLAYLLRCFSRCGLIVVLNQFGPNNFDLTLSRPSDDYADVHVGGEQIGNPGLWKEPIEGYRPWSWPIIPDARSNFEKCADEVKRNADSPILEYLGLDKVIDWLPKRARDFLLPGKIEEITFHDFVHISKGGLLPKDRVLDSYQIARIAAARIRTWLNLIILPEQNVLVDAPHLISRFPSLIEKADEEIKTWNQLCSPTGSGIGGLLNEVSKPYEFSKSHWLWRPAWLWPLLRGQEKIEEVKYPGSGKEYDWVFCEDLSRFLPIDYTRSFISDVSPPFTKRYVLDVTLEDPKISVGHYRSGDTQDASIVEYLPGVAFSL